MNKKPWQSKTILIGAVMGLAPLFPSVNAFIQAHPDSVVQGFAVVSILLRMVTKGKIELV